MYVAAVLHFLHIPRGWFDLPVKSDAPKALHQSWSELCKDNCILWAWVLGGLGSGFNDSVAFPKGLQMLRWLSSVTGGMSYARENRRCSILGFPLPVPWPGWCAHLILSSCLTNSRRGLKPVFWKAFSLRTGQRTILMRDQPSASLHWYPYWADGESQVKGQGGTSLKSRNKTECFPQTSQDFSFQPALVVYIDVGSKAT